jgi:hypothetical protein
MKFIGFHFDIAKWQPPSTSCVYLGRIEKYDRMLDLGVITAELREERRLHILKNIETSLSDHQKIGVDHASLRGKIVHARSCLPGRSACAPLTNDEGPSTRRTMDQLKYFQALFDSPAKREYRAFSDSHSTQAIAVWSDASFSRTPDGTFRSRLCWLVRPRHRQPFGRVYDIPHAFWAKFLPRISHITAAEALAIIMFLKDSGEMTRDASFLFFIDNLSALCGFVNGYSKSDDLSSMYLGTNLKLSDDRCDAWWEWVPSSSNIADGGSRIGITDAVAAEAGITLSVGDWPEKWPDFMSFKS